jgi:hypothetical protein
MDYKHKYLKYKQKYITLRNRIKIGGTSNKILVVSIENMKNGNKIFSYKHDSKFTVISILNNKVEKIELDNYLLLLELIEGLVSKNAIDIKMTVFETNVELDKVYLKDINKNILFETDKFVPIVLYTIKVGKLIRQNRDMIVNYMSDVIKKI